MNLWQVTITREVQAESMQAALDEARRGMGDFLDCDAVLVEFCPNCGVKWPEKVRRHGVDENRQEVEDWACTKCEG